MDFGSNSGYQKRTLGLTREALPFVALDTFALLIFMTSCCFCKSEHSV